MLAFFFITFTTFTRTKAYDSLLDVGEKSMGTLQTGLTEGQAVVNLFCETEQNNFVVQYFHFSYKGNINRFSYPQCHNYENT